MHRRDFKKEKIDVTSNDGDEYKDQPMVHSPIPITPKMLIKALHQLKKKTFKGLFFTPKEVALQILRKYPSVEKDLHLLLLEVTDKLICASAAGLIGTKQDAGYYAFDFRQQGMRTDTKSELMFWVFYKKILSRKRQEEEERRRNWSEKKDSISFGQNKK